MEHLVTVRVHAPRNYHPHRVAELVFRLITAGQEEATYTVADPDLVDQAAEDAVQLRNFKVRTIFLRPKLVLRAALEDYQAGRKWEADGLHARVFDELEKAFGIRYMPDAPLSQLPPPRLVDAGFTVLDVQRVSKLSAEDAEMFLLKHERAIRDAMVKAGFDAVRQLGDDDNYERS